MKESNRFRPDRSGVYLAPPEPAALREAAVRAGCAWQEVKMAGVRDKAGFLAAAAHDLKFPSHFGHNWDAFADCLADSAADNKGRVIAIEDVEPFASHAPDDWATALEILRNAAADSRSRRHTLIVLVDHAARDSALRHFF